MKKVLVFGVFDKLHPGHLHFLETARALGESLVVLVARESTVLRLKNKIPRDSEGERVKALSVLPNVSRAVLGDEELGTYAVLKDEKPEIIALGYDQMGLKKDLEERMERGEIPSTELVVLGSHEPEKYKSSLISS